MERRTMALLARNLGILFIMAPHTGSTAIGKVLLEDFGAQYLPEREALDAAGKSIPRKHTSLPQLIDSGILDGAFDDPAERKRLVIVSTIRNPFDSNVSSWHRWYRKLDPNHVEFNPSFSDRARGSARQPPSDIEEARVDFEDWLTSRYQPSRLMRLRGQYKRAYTFRWTLGSDVVLQHEQLQDGFDALLRAQGIKEKHEIPQVNVVRKPGRRYQDWYTANSRAIVEGAFADDVAEFGYRFEEG
ncbi:MAG: hypothetical protein ACC726_04610 [Chloroflexota bacterium]